MARVVETEPVVVHETEHVHHVHDEAPRSSTGLITAIILLIIVVVALVWWRPWTNRVSSPTINVHTPAPNVNVTR